MLIGILRCDKVRSSLSAEFGEYPDMIMKCISDIDDKIEFKTYLSDLGQLPDSIDDCDAYIITGNRYIVSDNEETWINQLRDFIVKLNKSQIKTIGICFGHQLIAEAMGGKVERADCGWQIGEHQAKIIDYQNFMQPSVNCFRITMMCEDQIQSIPESAKVIASSDDCENLMLQYNNHILSIQGHPEFSRGFAKNLINARKEDFPIKRLEKGLASFSENESEGNLIFKWFINFIKS